MALAEALGQEVGFPADRPAVDDHEEREEEDGERPDATRDRRADTDQEAAEIERIARVRVGTGDGELALLPDRSGGPRTDRGA